MSQLKCYIKPFNDAGVYQDWIDVSADTDFGKIGSLSEKLEGSEYDVGVFSFSSISLKLNNKESTYSDIDDINSMFRFRRTGSKVKITWQKGDTDAVCNFAICGEEYPYYELTLLEGLLNDESLTSDLRLADVTFKVLSYASVFKTIETPFSGLTNGDTVTDILTTLLAEPDITKTITVGTISPNYNAVIDDVSDYEDTDISEVINDMLLVSNSVLYFDGETLNIGARTPTATVQETFYGQASRLGIESIIKLDKIRSGLSRMFNLWRWEETAISSRDNTSIDDRGLRTKDFAIASITNSTTQQTILDTYKNEFFIPKREFTFSTKLDVENLKLLDRVNFDYPTPYFVNDGDSIPYYNVAVYGTAKYPYGEYGLTLTATDHYKIIGIRIDLKKDIITYEVREV